ncbi:MAG TPA: 30S ribosomal protein S20 [Patescibacteria group bacterium]|nr:30S ribosomal protein S20 [Patescibacteria group bacterium]
MPISKSAKKSLRAARNKRRQNLIWERKFKSALKKVDKTNVSETTSLIDKTAKKHLISKNKAARLKSHLSKKFAIDKEAKVQGEKVKATAKEKKGKGRDGKIPGK